MITSRKITFLLAMVALLAMLSGTASAQEPFPCDETAYVIQGTGGNPTGGVEQSWLTKVNQSVSPFVFTKIPNPAPIPGVDAGNYSGRINNLGFRFTNRLLYGWRIATTTPDVSAGLVTIDATGTLTFTPIPGMPISPEAGSGVFSSNLNAGDISADGKYMYLTDSGGGTSTGNPNLYVIDLDTLTLVATIPITGAGTNTRPVGRVNDFAYNRYDGLLYGADQDYGELAILDPTTGIRTDVPLAGLPAALNGPFRYGGAWFGFDGTLYLYENNQIGGIFPVYDPTGTPTLGIFIDGPNSVDVDATACAGGPVAPALTIEKSTNGEDADTSPGPSITVGDTVTWTYNVTNTGNVDLTNVLVTDDRLGVICTIASLPAGTYNNTCTETGTAVAGQYENIGKANVTVNGVEYNDTDPSHYFGETAAAEPFTCDGKAFVVQDQLANLYNVTLTDGSATLTQVFPTATIEYNNMGYRSTDGLLYAVQLQGTGYGDGIVQIIRIDANGNIEGLGLPPGLPTGVQTRFDAGDISADGNTMYITFGARSDDPQTTLGYNLKLYKLDLGSWAGPPNPLPAVTNVSITGDNAWVNDWAYNPNDGLLYGGDQWGNGSGTPAQLSVLNTTTGDRTDYDLVGTPLPRGPYGAAWFDIVRDTVFLYKNTGTIYEIDVSDLGGAGPSILNSWTAPASTRNDGTFCPSAPQLTLQKQISDDNSTWIEYDLGDVLVGSDVYYNYTVTNTGTVTLTGITLADDLYPTEVAACNIADLAPGESASCYVGPITAEAGEHINTANATGTYEGTDYTSNDDDARYFGITPELTLQKQISDDNSTWVGYDLGNVLVGSEVYYNYTVTNTGTVTLTGITLADDLYPTEVAACNIGDLAPGESASCYVGPIAAVAGQHINTANATGTYEGTDYTSNDDDARYFGITPELTLQKQISDDNSTWVGYDLGNVLVGSEVYYNYTVTNTGTVTLTGITLADDLYPTEVAACNIGDLAPGESASCYVGPIAAVAGQHINTANATGTYEGTDYTSNDDDARYFGVTPELTLQKQISDDNSTWIEYDLGDVLVGSDVYYNYTVTNTGTVTLTAITLADDLYPTEVAACNIGDLAPGESASCYVGPITAEAGEHINTANATGTYEGTDYTSNDDDARYFGITPELTLQKQISDDNSTWVGYDLGNVLVGSEVYYNYTVTNTGTVTLTGITLADDLYPTEVAACNIGDLAPGESASCYIGPIAAVAGEHINTANATGTYEGTDYTSNDDDARYFGVTPELTLQKQISDDNSTWVGYDLGNVLVGSEVYYNYTVTNTGTVTLTAITLADDLYPTEVAACNIGDLAPGESASCYIGPIAAVAGQHINTANATGTYEGTDYTSNDDDARYFGVTPELTLQKQISDDNSTWIEYDLGDVLVGSDVYYNYTVTNTGTVTLTGITLADDLYPTEVAACNIGDLAPGESASCYVGPITAEAGEHINTANATGTYEGTDYTSNDDDARYFGVTPAIDIEKYTNGEDSDEPPGSSYVVGAPIEWTYVVTNIGDVKLENVVVTDDQLGTICTIGSLDIGESTTCTATGTAMVGQYANNGTATGDYDGMTATDTDPSHYFGIDAPGVGTPGYWKNHPEAWPVDEIEIGGIIYPRDDAIDYMMDPVKKDKTFTMFPALVAAKLNVLIGNEYDKCAEEAGIDFITEADAWMEENPIGSKVKGNSKEWKEGEPLYEWLDWYNNGYCFWAPERY
ncbi:DUF7507 domain-containing protein [Methanosarcina sp. Mfa9]|uniref:DUF7507 domain-containing protein n=1 Tax=Methanosarcina sp. Mfa9 TaxID=3439063 RepID=UPI003F8258F8